MYKRIISLFLALSICLGLSSPAFGAASVSPWDFDFTVTSNAELNNEFGFGKTRMLSSTGVDSLTMKISQVQGETYIATMIWNGQSIFMTGLLNDIECENGTSKIGFLDGTIFVDDIFIPVIANVTLGYDESVFVALTVEPIAENEKREIAFYGDFSTAVKEANHISYQNSVQQARLADLDNALEYSTKSVAIGNVKCQAHQDSVVAGYKVGTLSLFHADAIVANGPANVYAKINSDTNAVWQYIKSTTTYDPAWISNPVPVVANLQILSANSNFNLTANGYEPLTSSNTITVPIPVITLSGAFKITSLTLTLSSVTANKIQNGCGAEWQFSSAGGWGQTFDGSQNTQTGLGVQATYTYQTSGSTTVNLSATGSLTYSYYVLSPTTTTSIQLTYRTPTIKIANSSISVT